MISDTLFEAIEELDYYLNEPTFARCYKGELRERIVWLRNQMEDMRQELDTPPNVGPIDKNRSEMVENV